ncbi:MAG: hypothetical protein AUH30_03220 [Candidatus Rokubacteria bacterium 13_1_40CM_68_15]|nr:MAG: hypothetical protein AUH30_03220 [Candidatus Rokubacteria bacterium 13_1_40CM_68_15]
MSRRTGESLRRTEAEIAAEKAATLGRAGERLEEALRVAHAALARLDAASAGPRSAASALPTTSTRASGRPASA